MIICVKLYFLLYVWRERFIHFLILIFLFYIYMNSNIEKLKFKKLREDAFIPTKGSKLAAGYDLYSVEDKIIKSKSREMIHTGLSVAIPINSYGRVAPRSGLTWKHFIDVGAGVIDSDYRGECKLFCITK